MMKTDHKKQKTTKRNVVCVSGLNIDERDYDIMKKILAIDDDDDDDRFFSFRNFSVTDRTFEIYYSEDGYVGRVGIAGEDDECRVWNLDLTCNYIDASVCCEELMPELIIQLKDLRTLFLEDVTNFENQTATGTLQWIGRLKTLRALTVMEDDDCGKILNLSDEIGKLTNLQELTLGWGTEMISLPSSIGNLTNLRKLRLTHSPKLHRPQLGMVSLPSSSIGDLTNLKNLDISGNEKLQSLPDELGRLISLEELALMNTDMLSLPSCIGDLTNLKRLYLCGNKKLQSLPDELGRLSLEELNLGWYTEMVSLPSSIGNLTNLRKLNLHGNQKLQSLPDEIIGRLTSLEELNLGWCTEMVSLPSSIGDLTNLKIFDISGNEKLQSLRDEILNITRKCPLLGCLGYEVLSPLLEFLGNEVPQCEALVNSLLRNRIRSLLLAPSSKISPSLWPSIFHNANHASSSKNFLWCNCTIGDCLNRHQLPQSDIIFHLLVELSGVNHIISEQV